MGLFDRWKLNRESKRMLQEWEKTLEGPDCFYVLKPAKESGLA